MRFKMRPLQSQAFWQLTHGKLRLVSSRDGFAMERYKTLFGHLGLASVSENHFFYFFNNNNNVFRLSEINFKKGDGSKDKSWAFLGE